MNCEVWCPCKCGQIGCGCHETQQKVQKKHEQERLATAARNVVNKRGKKD